MKRHGLTNKSKFILARLVVLYDHLDKLESLPKPRSENADLMIEAIYERIRQEQKKLRK